MKRHALTLALLLSFSTLGPLALAAPTPVTIIRAGDTIVIQGTDQIRYQTDPLTRRLILPETVLAPGTTVPDGLSWQKADGTIQLVIPDGTTYALSPDGKSLILTPPGRQAVSPIPQDERAPILYPLSFADPGTVAGLLQSIYPNTRVVIDQRQRALIVVANPADRNLLLDLLKQLDASRPQIQFEAEILEVNQDTTDSLGIQYDSIFTFKLTEGESPSLLKMGKLGRSPLSLSMGLNLLKTNGAARVLARPRITTIDGLEARINSTQTTPVVTANSSGGTSVQSITTGITLRMTPKVAPDGTVETNLTISVSVPTGTTSQGVPQFSTREATTTVRVGNGEPIAIGGLLEERKVTGTQKVPVLGDIPVLGKLFSTTRTDTRRSDLIIVVTPRLVTSPNERPPVTTPTALPAGTGGANGAPAAPVAPLTPPTGPTTENTPATPAGTTTLPNISPANPAPPVPGTPVLPGHP
ncbi:type II secretion system protein GspD [Deinococcus metallilatus]|uniref:Type II secretion system protein GspD n=1 Tax=Deinococcus metallilatus TaxID=1211322 RepID=A0ABR6N1W2_9DEIO|nr:type II and III secretion system protein [Deinococcus metallilatus]MBB5297476.1 hypothetical protein [Deinococcus metallilatus]GMA14378.1 hypothetical protein GCM10025871_07090 [Deinococcus metallilatus]